MTARTGGVDDQRRKPLDPPAQGDMVDLDTSLRQELLEVSVRQSIPEVPATANKITSGGNWKPANAELG